MSAMDDLRAAMAEVDAYYKKRGIFQGKFGFGESPALIVIDMAYGWTDPAYAGGSARLDSAVAAIQKLLGVSRTKGLPIFFTTSPPDQKTHLKSAADFSPGFRTWDARACEIDERVRPLSSEMVILKEHASAFASTPLIGHLIANRVDTLLITGCSTSACVRATATDAKSNHFRPMVIREAVEDRSEIAHEWTLFDIQARFADVVSLEETLTYLRDFRIVAEEIAAVCPIRDSFCLAGVLIAMTTNALADEPIGPTREQASAFAKLALKGIRKEYPNKMDHVLGGPKDLQSPKVFHPAFFGCYDWHSCVHGHWMLARLLRLFPDLPEAKEIRGILNEHLTASNLKLEADYFDRPDAKSFERPYGWAWLLKLAAELHGWEDVDARSWSKNLKPLADKVAKRYLDYFPKQTYPIRTGVHPNTAFGLSFAHDYARAVGDKRLQGLVEERARTYFGKDKDVPASWEPGGADFFSPSLMEADLMRRVLSAAEFQKWFSAFLPSLSRSEPKSLLDPATVTDRTDPQIVHLDGLNLSRAWCMKSIANALPADDPARKILLASAKRHEDASLKHVTSGDYAGEHWLASFAVYLLSVHE